MEDYFYLSIYKYLDYLVACKIKKIASVMAMNLKKVSSWMVKVFPLGIFSPEKFGWTYDNVYQYQ